MDVMIDLWLTRIGQPQILVNLVFSNLPYDKDI